MVHSAEYSPATLAVLVGYDTTMVLNTNPNVTHYKQWWAPEALPSFLRVRTKPGKCEPVKLTEGTTIRTNSSLPMFSYCQWFYYAFSPRNNIGPF